MIALRRNVEALFRPPPPARFAVDDTVRQSGTHGRGRRMTVTAVRGAAARCEWTHDGKRHADWFAVSGLRKSTA